MILHALDVGAGPPVALLHGLFGRAQNLGAVARHLSARHRVISLDMRNHGASPHAPGMAYEALAADVLETLEAMGALPAVLLGHSMGGKAAMVAALTTPAAVSRLIVLDIAPVAYAHHNRRVAAALLGLPLRPRMTRGDADRLLAPDVPDPAVRAFLLQNLLLGEAPAWRIGLVEIAAGVEDIEGFPDLPGTALYGGPTLFLRGADSDYVLEECFPAITDRFPEAQVATLEKAGHWLHADQPQAFVSAVDAFLG
jgi:pimeloyl-ACP methyl ester carboxylesterase